MRHTHAKKILVLLLAVCLLVGCLPLAAGAEENPLAISIPLDETVSGAITETQDYGLYRLDLPSSGLLTLKFAGNMERVRLYMCDQSNSKILDENYSWNSTTQQISKVIPFYLISGSYYFSVQKPWDETGTFSFTPIFTPIDETFTETQGDEGNNSLALANPIAMKETYTGLIAENDDEDFYKFTLDSSGRISCQFDGNLADVTLTVYDAAGNDLWYTYSWNDTYPALFLDLVAGDYYFHFRKRNGETGVYSFKMNFASAEESFAESQTKHNDSLETSSGISMGVRYQGVIASNEMRDFYCFTVPSAGDVIIRAEAAFQYLDMYLYDENGQEVWKDVSLGWNSVTQKITVEKTLTLSPGAYYLCFEKDGKTGNYSFSVATPGNKPTDSLPTQFTDVPAGEYYVDAVKWAVENNITTGTSATKFSPNNTCTRAQAVTFLWRAAGSPEPASSSNPFTDVKSGEYYYKAVLWAVEKGITNGATKTTFNPDGKCIREQIVTFLYRAEGSPAVTGGTFTDVAAGSYYENAVKWAVANDITNGTSDTKFSPKNNCTRGQIVTFLYRYKN